MNKYVYILIVGILLVILILIYKRESFTLDLYQVGGIVSSQMKWNDTIEYRGYSAGNTTVVRKLTGDSGQTVIILHNSPFNQSEWATLFMHVQSLKVNGQKIPTLISYDLRGHGTAWLQADPKYEDTDINNHQWSYSTYIQDLYEIYQKYVGTGKITLVGYGFGGDISLAYALQHPETLERLCILHTGLSAVTNRNSEIEFFSKWLNTNYNVTYLTIPKSYLDQQMCIWFENLDKVECPLNVNDTYDITDTVEYLIGYTLWRQASSGTYLQVSKLESLGDFRADWEKAKVDFPVIMLSATLDPYALPSVMKAEFPIIQKAAAADSKLYIVHGKHGFPMIHPIFVYGIMTGQDMSSDPLTVETL